MRRTGEIDGDDAVDEVRRVLKIGLNIAPARAVHQNVDAWISFQHLGCGSPDRFRIAHVDGSEIDLEVGAGGLLFELGAFCGVEVRADNGCAGAGKRHHRCFADAGSAAGNQ